jgi:hypothetical protein
VEVDSLVTLDAVAQPRDEDDEGEGGESRGNGHTQGKHNGHDEEEDD